LAFLDLSSDGSESQPEAEKSLRLILAQAREGRGELEAAAEEYRWLWKQSDVRQDYYRKKVDGLTADLNRADLQVARQEMASARELARARQPRQASAVAARALAQLQEHGAEHLELAQALIFLADQHLSLNEPKRAQEYFEKAADQGYLDPRMQGDATSGVHYSVSVVHEDRFYPSGRIGQGVSYPIYRKSPDKVKPNAHPSRTPSLAHREGPPPISAANPTPKAPPRLVLPSLKLPDNGRETLPSYQSQSGDTLPSYNRPAAPGTLPSYENTDTRK
jgi:hypothetical protein